MRKRGRDLDERLTLLANRFAALSHDDKRRNFHQHLNFPPPHVYGTVNHIELLKSGMVANFDDGAIAVTNILADRSISAVHLHDHGPEERLASVLDVRVQPIGFGFASCRTLWL